MLGPRNRSIIGADRQTRKDLKSNGDELVGLFLTSTMRSLLEGDRNEASSSPAEVVLSVVGELSAGLTLPPDPAP